MPERSKLTTQTKRDTLILQAGGFGVGGQQPHTVIKLIVTKVEQRKKLEGLKDDGRKKTGYTEITLHGT